MDRGVNPYQPVELNPAPRTLDTASEVNFYLTRSQLRHGEAQYLLHWHPLRLINGSLALIIGSVAIIAAGQVVFGNPVAAIFVTMAISSAVYLALVHGSKTAIRRHLRDHGLVHAAACSLRADRDHLVLTSPTGEFQWSTDQLQAYRTRKGLLVCPEPLLFVFVPKTSDFQAGSYKTFRQRIASLTVGKTPS